MSRQIVSVKNRNSEEDMFPPITAQVPLFSSLRPITCLVCKRYGQSDMALPQLCIHCGRDLAATRNHVDTMLHKIELRDQETHQAWIDALSQATTKTLTLWELYDELRIDGNSRAAEAEAKARANEPGEIFNLIRLWLDYNDASEAYAAALAWVADCEAIL